MKKAMWSVLLLAVVLSVGAEDDYRSGENGLEYRLQATAATGDTVALTLNGTAVAGNELWMKAGDVVELSVTPASGRRFLQWKGTGAFATGHYAGDAATVISPTQAASLTAVCTTPKTRTWNPTTKDTSGRYLWKTEANWLDETGATGKPLIGDTVVFGTASSTGVCYNISESSANNPLYVVRYEDIKTVSMNQGSFALLAGGQGLQYLRNANSGSNWSGIMCVGDGIVPINIANNVNYVMQKGCLLGTLADYRSTPIVVKQGPGTVINYCESGNYNYTVPTTRLQEGRWDMTMSTTMQNVEFDFDGPAAKRLTMCYGSYTSDLTFNGGGICEINGAENHTIEANDKNGRVVFTGTPKFNPMVFSGRFTKGAGLKWSPSASNCVFVCSNAVSDTAGKLTVAKGTVKLVDGASFTALSELSVATGAVLQVEAGSGAGMTATNLVVEGASSRLELAAGVQLACTSATLGGVALSPGTYGAGNRTAAWIVGEGTVTVAEGPANSAVWCGANTASTSTAQSDNWAGNAVPDLTAGDLLATFATGGSEATLNGSAAFSGLVLKNDFGGSAFAFAAGSNAGATVNGNGISVIESASPTTWSMAWPLTLGTAQSWSVGSNAVLQIDAPVSGSTALTVENAGTLRLNATSPHTGALEIKGGTVEVRADNALGAASRTVTFHHLTTKYVFGGDITLESPLYSTDLCEAWSSFMSVEANAHVTFKGQLAWKAEGGVTFGAGSTTVFAGGLRFETDGMKGKIIPYGSGTVIVSNKNIATCRAWEGQANHPVTLDLCCANNALNDSAYWGKFPSGRLLTHVANATKSDARLYFADATFDLCGQNQAVGLIATTAKTKIVSDSPATLTVNSSSEGDSQNGTYGGDTRIDTAAFSGQVSLKKAGSHPHALGATSTTTGTVEVAAGTLTFNASGKWPNATGVKLSGGALVLRNAEAMGPNAQWEVKTGTDPVVTLDFTGLLPADKLTVDGVHLPGGVYGATGSGAQYEVAWISGTGFLKVATRATVIILK